jgi:hypothetical protein
VTIEAAYSWRKEDLIGSIKPGKIANLTVLEADPYNVDPKKLKDIPVWGTVFEGNVFPVPEADRIQLATKSLPVSSLTAQHAYGQIGPTSDDHSPGEDNCLLNDLSRMVVLAYTENVMGN